MTDIDNDEAQAVAEIKVISIGARYHLQHKIRNYMQIIAGHSETQGLNDIYIENPTTERLQNELIKAHEKLTAINEAVQTMSEDMRRLGL